jgi:glutamate-1-semialdehyde 2,1-aminomutase
MDMRAAPPGSNDFYGALAARRPEIVAEYRRLTPRSAALAERAAQVFPGGYTRDAVMRTPYAPFVVEGAGGSVTDADGRRLTDLWFNATSLPLGHAHPSVVQAIQLQAAKGTAYYAPTEHELALAELLAARVPSFERVRFANSGSEAVMMAIRLARAATGRSAILRFQGSYHGSYDAAMQTPARGVPASVEGEIITVAIGDLEGLVAALDEHGPRLACVLFDAMPNRAGLRFVGPEFASALREQTRRHGVLLIQDEVITLRLAFGGLQSLCGIEPDITTVAKVIGGGFPIGGVGGGEDLMALFDPRGQNPVVHPGTFNANPVSMRAGAVALDLLTAGEIARINALGDRLRESLAQRGWEVSGQGSLLQVRAADPGALWWSLYGEGVLIAANGLMCISTAMGDAEVERALEAFDRVGSG